MQFWALVIDTFREAKDRWLLVIWFLLALIEASFFLFVMKIAPAAKAGKVAVSYPALEKAKVIMSASLLVNDSLAVTMAIQGALITFLLIAIFSFFIPSLLKCGILDLHLSKPISRFRLILYKYFAGILVAVTFLGGFLVVGWGILSLRTGHFTLQPFLFLPLFAVIFAIAYSLVLLCNVITRGPITGLVVYFLYAFMGQNFLENRHAFQEVLNQAWFTHLSNSLYLALPRLNECLELALAILQNKEIASYAPLYSSSISGAGFVIVASLVFSGRDYQ